MVVMVFIMTARLKIGTYDIVTFIRIVSNIILSLVILIYLAPGIIDYKVSLDRCMEDVIQYYNPKYYCNTLCRSSGEIIYNPPKNITEILYVNISIDPFIQNLSMCYRTDKFELKEYLEFCVNYRRPSI